MSCTSTHACSRPRRSPGRAAATVLALLAFAGSWAIAQEPALRLEPQAERIARLHAQAARDVLAGRAKRSLHEAVAEFDRALGAVARRPSAGELRDNYLLLALLWKDYRAWALKPATPENARRLAERVEEVSWIASKGVRLLGEPASPGARLAIDAMRVATLSQRLARMHLAGNAGARGAPASAQAAIASADLRHTLARLRTAPANSPAIATEVQMAEGQLDFLMQAASGGDGAAGARGLEFIAKGADHILEAMERAARLYERLPP